MKKSFVLAIVILFQSASSDLLQAESEITEKQSTFEENLFPSGDDERHWEAVQPSDISMTILFENIFGMEVVEGTELAGLTPDGFVAGAEVLDPDSTRWGLALWRDEPFTDEVEGFAEGEAIQLLFWDPVHKWELGMSVEFLTGEELVFYNNSWYVINATLSIEKKGSESIPSVFGLDSVYPNPFNSTSVIQYSVPVVSEVSIELFDLGGREVRHLFSGVNSPGIHRLTLNAINLPSGVYFIAMDAGKFRTFKMVDIIR